MLPDDESTLPVGGSPAPRPGPERPGDEIGPYKLVSLLGEGGFGEVWLAERRHPFVQRVALKVIKPGMDSKAVLARFEQERQALAVMNHPGIAKVLDGGLTSRGRPYFAMEYVKGEPLTAFCDRVKLGIEERLRLFEQACEAVQHAHLKGIVHRDLKPSNILAFMVEGEGPKLKVIDFGVAKAMSQRMTEQTIFTETGQMIGTPEYMSPEQADPTAGDIDTRSDIYSLGVLLYELLVGATPFDPKELRNKAYGEIQRTIREQDPPSPSARLSTLGTKDREALARIEASRHSRMSDLVRRLRGELEWIPLKAMRKEPQHRYQTAIALAEDVRNYLEGRPLVAAPESTAYRVRKYVRRNRALVVGAGAVALALVAGLSLATWQWRVAATAKDEAIAAKDEAVTSEAKALAEKVAADRARQDAEAAKRAAQASEARAKESESRVTEQLERSNDLLGVIAAGAALDAVRRHDFTATRGELDLLTELGRGDRFPARLAAAWSDQSLGETLRGHEGQVSSVTFSPDGKTLASGSGDTTIRLWSAIPMRDRVQAYRGQMGEVERVRAQLRDRAAAVGESIDAVRAFDTEVRADPRFQGDLRTAALIVVGEVHLARQEIRARKAEDERRSRREANAARTRRLEPLSVAFTNNEWDRALQLTAEASPDDLASQPAAFWNALAWSGLTELPADSPQRDLGRLLGYAERAVALSKRKDGAILDTLARAHWELGDKARAIEVQREAIIALSAQIAALPADAGAAVKQQPETMLVELRDTLAKYEREPPPAPPPVQPAAPRAAP